MYYGLKNFYQNHRRYVKSRDDNQLLGKSMKSLNSECHPYDYDQNRSFYAPCGAIANSLFNDTFQLSYSGTNNTTVPANITLLATQIAWSSDKNIKFRNPSNWDNTVKPKNWRVEVFNLSDDPNNNGYQNEDLIVWMRTAALPTFRKLHRRIDHSNTFKDGLPSGYYTVNIEYSK
jgi:hypothetical protein